MEKSQKPKLLKKAIQVAESGDRTKKHLLGAVAIRKDGCVVSATNGKVITPVPRMHAEIRALNKAGFGSTLYVAKVLKTGDIGIAKPCKNCMTKIKNKGVKRIYYTISNNEYGVIVL